MQYLDEKRVILTRGVKPTTRFIGRDYVGLLMDRSTGLAALSRLGLSGAEAHAYAALTHLAHASAEQLAKSTGMHRRNVYDACSALLQKGLVHSVFVDGKKKFATTGMPRLEAWVAENKKDAESFLIQEEGRNPVTVPEPIVQVFNGKEGVKAIWADKLRERKPIYWYAGAMQGARGYIKNYYPLWDAQRVRFKIPIKMIFIDVPGVKEFLKKEPLFEGRSIPAEMYSNAAWWLYGNKMAIVFWRDNPFGILIEDADLAKTYLNFFNQAWKNAKPQIKNLGAPTRTRH